MNAVPREPARIEPTRNTLDLIAGVLALVAIAALLVGVPFALCTFFGSPIPHTLPSAETFTHRLEAAALMRVLVIVVWLAWFQLAACVVVEAYAGIRGMGIPVRVPLAGGPQALAHRLVVAALLLFTATTVVTPALTAPRATHIQVKEPPRPRLAEPGRPAQAVQSAQAAEYPAPSARQDPERPTPPTLMEKDAVRKIYRVRPSAGRHHESLWGIAEKCLGDGRRYREIYALNRGKVQPDGTRLTMASLIRPGWVLDMPADATHVEIVDGGAEDVRRERGVPPAGKPGGVDRREPAEATRRAVDAAREAARQEARDDQADRAAGRPPVERGPDVTAPEAQRQPAPPKRPAEPAHPAEPGRPAPRRLPPRPSARPEQPQGGSERPRSGAGSGAGSERPQSGAGTGSERPQSGAGAGAGSERPRPGAGAGSERPPSSSSPGSERPPSGAGAGAGSERSRPGPGAGSGPSRPGARAGSERPKPARPHDGSGQPSAGAQRPERPSDRSGQRSPAEQSGFGWPEELAVAALLAAGLLAALGRRRREQFWHRAFGTMLARPQGAAALAEQALRLGADTEGSRLLDLGLRQLSKALAAQDRTLPTVYGVHLGAGGLDLWIAPADRDPPAPWQEYDNGQVWRLSATALEPSGPAGVADVLAPYPGLVSIGTNDTGRILVDLEAAHGLIALRGPDEARRAVLAAIAVELATNRWSDHMRITLVGFGEELPLVAPERIRAVATLAEALPELEIRAEEVRQALAASGVDSVLTGRCRGVFGEAWMPHYLIMADAPTPDEAERLVTLARTGRRMAAGYIVAGEVPGATWTWEVSADGRLRAGVLGFDVAAQLVPEQHYRAVVELVRTAGRLEGVPYRGVDEPSAPVMGESRPAVDIRLLGPIEVEAPGAVEESRRPLCTEVLAYLAAHPEGAHPTVLGGAVWPRGVSAAVRDATVARVADWVGHDTRGRSNLYYDDHGRIRLGSEVRVDWEVFRWLLWRSAAEPASEPAYLSYALDLVRGGFVEDRPKGRYSWLATGELEYEVAARIADVAHRLVLMRLDEGDARAAVTAARAGLRLATDDEGLWRDLLRATHATGDQAAVRTVVDELCRRADAEPYAPRLRPETEALVNELLPDWHRVTVEGTG